MLVLRIVPCTHTYTGISLLHTIFRRIVYGRQNMSRLSWNVGAVVISASMSRLKCFRCLEGSVCFRAVGAFRRQRASLGRCSSLADSGHSVTYLTVISERTLDKRAPASRLFCSKSPSWQSGVLFRSYSAWISFSCCPSVCQRECRLINTWRPQTRFYTVLSSLFSCCLRLHKAFYSYSLFFPNCRQHDISL
jgi:hypothetical protein